jgi:hypothetical protein
MVQSPDVLKNLKKGDKVTIYNADNKERLGSYTFDYFTSDTIELVGGSFAFLSEVIVLLAGCQHEWKRIDLFRTTEFHCKHCPVVRPFDIEKDEAA